ELEDAPSDSRRPLREQLANHFVQRRRPDIEEWQDNSVFPQRLTTEITYRLTGEWGKLFDDVLAYARELVERAEGQDTLRQRVSWLSALALLCCISSSPAAAVSALRTRLHGRGLSNGATDEAPLTLEDAIWLGQDHVQDELADDLSTEDVE